MAERRSPKALIPVQVGVPLQGTILRLAPADTVLYLPPPGTNVTWFRYKQKQNLTQTGTELYLSRNTHMYEIPLRLRSL